MTSESRKSEWQGLESDARVRLRAVREYATTVFGKEVAAAAWMGSVNVAVRDGSCTITDACQTLEGFLEAMFELSRVARTRQFTHAPVWPPRPDARR